MSGKKWQIILAGTGGQGLILAGIMLAKAAVLEGKQVVQTQTYGIQTRGGFSQAEVVLGEETIYFPKCEEPNLVLALSQDAYERHCRKVSDNCVMLYDSKIKVASKRMKDLGYPFEAKAIDLGNEKVINSLALGAIAKLCPAIGKVSIERVLMETLPSQVIDLNLTALDAAFHGIKPPLTAE